MISIGNGCFRSRDMEQFVNEVCFEDRLLYYNKYWDGEKFHIAPFFMDLSNLFDCEDGQHIRRFAKWLESKLAIKRP